MVSMCIRKYSEDTDYDSVRTVFAAGMYSLLPGYMIEALTKRKHGPIVAGLVVAAATAGKALGAGPGQLIAIIASLSVACLAALYLFTYYQLSQYVKGELKGNMANIEQYFDAGFWVAEMDGEVVGTVGLKQVNENTAQMYRLSVVTKARGLGLAKRLVQEVEKSAHEHNFKRIILNTSTAQQPAIALYRKLGYQTAKAVNIKAPFKPVRMFKHIG